MKQEDTRKKILAKALKLFSQRGYDAVSVGDIAAAVGVKAPSLYNRFSGKRAIFDAIAEATAEQYEQDTAKIRIHVQDASRDFSVFEEITEDALFEKVRQIFAYSLHDETICRLRKMLTLEQFRSPELAALYSSRYVERLVACRAAIFRDLIAAGSIRDGDAQALALLYVAPINALIGICDRQPDREEECLQKLRDHVHAFFRLVQPPCGAQPAELPAYSEKEGLTL